MRQVEGQPGGVFNANRSLWVRNEPVGKLLPTPSNSEVPEVRAFAFLFFPLFMVPATQGVLSRSLEASLALSVPGGGPVQMLRRNGSSALFFL